MTRTMLALATALLLPVASHAQTTAAPTALAAPLTAQDQADIARVQAYLNDLHSLKARFLQVAPDGTTAGGTAWIDRPGRLRFEYAPPSPLLLVAGHGLVFFHDSQLNQTSNFALSATPLSILLSPDLKLSGDITVTGIARAPGQLQVTLVRTPSPGDGSLTLIFSDPPLQLRQWSVIDAQHQETRVSLLDMQTGGKFDQSMFDFVDPKLLGRPAPLYGNKP